MKRILLVLMCAISFVFGSGEKSIAESDYEIVKGMMKNNQPTMLEFGSNSCRSCKEMGKILYEVKEKNPNSNIFYLNVKKNKEAVMKYKIRMIPTQIFLDKEQNVIGSHVGGIPKDELLAGLKEMEIIK